MKIIYEDDQKSILRFDRGEEVVSGLIKHTESVDLQSATFSGLGACDFAELSYYDFDTQEYKKKEFAEDLEIVNLTGNISWFNSFPAIHLHGTLTRKDFSAIGGHIFRLLVSGTCEIHLQKIGDRLERKNDEQSGLNILSD